MVVVWCLVVSCLWQARPCLWVSVPTFLHPSWVSLHGADLEAIISGTTCQAGGTSGSHSADNRFPMAVVSWNVLRVLSKLCLCINIPSSSPALQASPWTVTILHLGRVHISLVPSHYRYSAPTLSQMTVYNYLNHDILSLGMLMVAWPTTSVS